LYKDINMLFKLLAIPTLNSVIIENPIVPEIISHETPYIQRIYKEILDEPLFKQLDTLIQSLQNTDDYNFVFRHLLNLSLVLKKITRKFYLQVFF